ncbi:MAG: formylglycine-generating enzyme family protein [Candidatus Adiutrix sp.]|nr:formylglycine-generating enzyme family protein [Candidatus Adiutrix sp.]
MKRIKLWSLAALYAFLLILAPGASLAAEKTYTNSLGMEFTLIPAGSFTMGADKDLENANYYNETPQHRVSLSQPFYLGAYEVTQEQWTAVMGDNPSYFKGRNNPVQSVSWDGIQIFIQRLNQKEGHARYRLPTEAEWEYAARAGTTGAYSFGDDEGSLGLYAWYEGNSDGKTHPVGQKQPNAWGLYDMYGNVWEWVQDWYGRNYSSSSVTDPKGPSSGSTRVFRGGSWSYPARYCRAAARGNVSPFVRFVGIGFRHAISHESPGGGEQARQGAWSDPEGSGMTRSPPVPFGRPRLFCLSRKAAKPPRRQAECLICVSPAAGLFYLYLIFVFRYNRKKYGIWRGGVRHGDCATDFQTSQGLCSGALPGLRGGGAIAGLSLLGLPGRSAHRPGAPMDHVGAP